MAKARIGQNRNSVGGNAEDPQPARQPNSSMHRGYVKSWRKTQDSWIASDPNCLSVFMHLLWDCAYTPRKRSPELTLQAGQSDLTLDQLAQKCGISRDMVRTALKKLEKDSTIRRARIAPRKTLTTIVNWDTYQSPDKKIPSKSPRNPLQIPSPKEVKKGRNEEVNSISSACADGEFEKWYSKYPKKVGKKAAYRAWSKLNASERISAIDAIEDMHRIFDGGSKQFVPNPATWLNAGGWDDDRDEWRRRAKGDQSRAVAKRNNFKVDLADYVGKYEGMD